ncbi:MAG: 2-C-methyl-D-erythritol 4-phosphate cytidylyltransferase [Gammaproteobacteria bacterium]|nr:2-C-methyl-D-erythritol 4-phosphate cytidylyltransferase [Gammaproteobacteria bacterium]
MSSSKANVWVVLPAAGSGSRMQSETPKQFLTINQKLVIEYSLELFLLQADIAGIVVVGDSTNNFLSVLLNKYQKVICVPGGNERIDSVLSGCQYISDNCNADWILVHDAARPCLHQADLCRLLKQRENFKAGALLAGPVVDTLKKRHENESLSTVSRDNLFRAFTPQLVRSELLIRALSSCRDEAFIPTDEAQAIERIGYHLNIIEGRQDNIKITYPDDLVLAELILQSHQSQNKNKLSEN